MFLLFYAVQPPYSLPFSPVDISLIDTCTALYRYQVVVISNQKKISLQSDLKAGKSDSKSLATFKEKVTTVMTQLDIPISVYAAAQYDGFRKPRTGMWKEMLEDYDFDVGEGVDLPGSIFVGDAAGRPGDHSCADR
jgi:bifunctional polynucleotide phosphatase/kinase